MREFVELSFFLSYKHLIYTSECSMRFFRSLHFHISTQLTPNLIRAVSTYYDMSVFDVWKIITEIFFWIDFGSLPKVLITLLYHSVSPTDTMPCFCSSLPNHGYLCSLLGDLLASMIEIYLFYQFACVSLKIAGHGMLQPESIFSQYDKNSH